MDTNKQQPTQDEVIDLRLVIAELFHHKLFFLAVWIVAGGLAIAYIMPQPRIYTTDLTLAPESTGENAGGTLSSLASNFGINLGMNESNDAFYPDLYPDLIETNEFLVDLLYTRVRSQDGKIGCSYLEYLMKHQKKNPVMAPFKKWQRQIKSYFEEPHAPVKLEKRLDPRHLSYAEDMLVEGFRSSIKCDVDVKTSVISLTVSAQDPEIAVQLADTARARLQDFITQYRTSKSRKDMLYYEGLTRKAKADYDDVVARYAKYCDEHQDIILQSYISVRDNLENEMQTRLTTYNAMQAQYEAAKAKVQERTPAFTLLKAAAVPVKPTSPKRMIFVAAMLFLATIGGVLFIFRRQVGRQLLGPKREEKPNYNNAVATQKAVKS